MILLALASSALAETKVVLRQAKGNKTLAPRFFQPAADGQPVPTAYFPTEKNLFDVVPVTLGANIDPNELPRLTMPDDDEPQTVVFRGPFGWTFVPEQPVVAYDMAQVPEAIRGALSLTIQTIVAGELARKPYDKTRVKKKEKYIKVPAPTLRNLTRTKKRRILATEEEYQIQAELDGTPEMTITHMPLLKQHEKPSRGVLMFVVDARLPVRGRVRYKIPSVVNASTGYRTVVAMHVVTEIRIERDGDELKLETPEVLRVDVRLENLDLSNDLLDAAHHPIRDLLNEEARRKHDRIRRQANKAIAKAVDDQTFRPKLLRYLGVF